MGRPSALHIFQAVKEESWHQGAGFTAPRCFFTVGKWFLCELGAAGMRGVLMEYVMRLSPQARQDSVGNIILENTL